MPTKAHLFKMHEDRITSPLTGWKIGVITLRLDPYYDQTTGRKLIRDDGKFYGEPKSWAVDDYVGIVEVGSGLCFAVGVIVAPALWEGEWFFGFDCLAVNFDKPPSVKDHGIKLTQGTRQEIPMDSMDSLFDEFALLSLP